MSGRGERAHPRCLAVLGLWHKWIQNICLQGGFLLWPSGVFLMHESQRCWSLFFSSSGLVAAKFPVKISDSTLSQEKYLFAFSCIKAFFSCHCCTYKSRFLSSSLTCFVRRNVIWSPLEVSRWAETVMIQCLNICQFQMETFRAFLDLKTCILQDICRKAKKFYAWSKW